MPSPNEKEPIKITLEDLANVAVPEPNLASPVAYAPGAKSYGTITEAAEQFAPVSEERGSILLQGWRRGQSRNLVLSMVERNVGEISGWFP
jgi:hypothetical protein